MPRDPQILRLEELDSAPVSCKTIVIKAFSGKSRAAGVKAKCLQCCNYVRDEITNCQVYRCPLWDYRPYQPGAIEPEGEE